MKKVVARLKGGLGNQLFCYAAARRLALARGMDLILDDVSGFVRDFTYRRQYGLGVFTIPCRLATPRERFEPFGRYRRGLVKMLSRRRPFEKRRYVEQQGEAYDPRVLELAPASDIVLDGLWQDERYFADVADVIRSDLRIKPPADEANRALAARIQGCNAVSLHVRWFAASSTDPHNVPPDFYRRAVEYVGERAPDAHYFVFSDNPEAARDLLALPEGRYTLVSHNQGDDAAYADLWLMSLCRHFILANSTFSWWGAWLGEKPDSVVVAPVVALHPSGWDFVALVPERWRLL